LRPEAATVSEIFYYLFGQGNLIFIREKSVNFESDACGNNHAEKCILAPLKQFKDLLA